MHAVHNDYAPASFKHVFVKNNTRDVTYELRNAGAYVVPAARIEFFKKFPIYTFPTAWNNAGNLVFYNNKITFQKAVISAPTQKAIFFKTKRVILDKKSLNVTMLVMLQNVVNRSWTSCTPLIGRKYTYIMLPKGG